MPLQENTFFDLDPKTVKYFVSQYPLHCVNYAPPKFGSCYVQRLRRRYINKKIDSLTLTLVKVTQNVAQYLLHHVTDAPTKFEVATSNGLGGNAFTKEKNII